MWCTKLGRNSPVNLWSISRTSICLPNLNRFNLATKSKGFDSSSSFSSLVTGEPPAEAGREEGCEAGREEGCEEGCEEGRDDVLEAADLFVLVGVMLVVVLVEVVVCIC